LACRAVACGKSPLSPKWASARQFSLALQAKAGADSLRHTYICMRLMEGADIYQIAKNCRTSVEMIEKFYASHIKNTLDAAAINVRKLKPVKKDDAFPNEISA
jgi:hypothetical protein